MRFRKFEVPKMHFLLMTENNWYNAKKLTTKSLLCLSHFFSSSRHFHLPFTWIRRLPLELEDWLSRKIVEKIRKKIRFPILPISISGFLLLDLQYYFRYLSAVDPFSLCYCQILFNFVVISHPHLHPTPPKKLFNIWLGHKNEKIDIKRWYKTALRTRIFHYIFPNNKSNSSTFLPCLCMFVCVIRMCIHTYKRVWGVERVQFSCFLKLRFI